MSLFIVLALAQSLQIPQGDRGEWVCDRDGDVEFVSPSGKKVVRGPFLVIEKQ